MKKTIFYAILMILILGLTSCQTVKIGDNNDTEEFGIFNLSDDEFVISAGDSKEEIKDSEDSNLDDEKDSMDEEEKEDSSMDEEKDSSIDKEESEDLPTKYFKEGDVVQFKKDLAYDPDGDDLKYTFSEPLDENGKWVTKIGDANTYIITVSVSDGKMTSSQKVKIVIESINNLPVISNFENIQTKEGETIKLTPKVTDEDGDEITLTYSGFMTSDSKTLNFEDAGKYTVTLTADDKIQKATKTISINVEDVNRAPKLESFSPISIIEGESVSIEPIVSDEDKDDLTITFGKPLNQDGIWETKIGDFGTHEVDITVSDGKTQVTKIAKINVGVLNEAPTIEIASTITFNEGDLIELKPIISDSDGDSVEVSYSGFMTKSIYQSNYEDEGTYEVTIKATDKKETVTKTVTIVIENSNRPPQFATDLFE